MFVLGNGDLVSRIYYLVLIIVPYRRGHSLGYSTRIPHPSAVEDDTYHSKYDTKGPGMMYSRSTVLSTQSRGMHYRFRLIFFIRVFLIWSVLRLVVLITSSRLPVDNYIFSFSPYYIPLAYFCKKKNVAIERIM